jgi:predicted dehydrogenase
MSRLYRVAVIGRTGRGNYGHGLDVVWKEFANCRIVAVADENEAGAKAAAQRLGAPAVYTDYQKMLRAERPDLVAVCPRWLDPHHDMVLACAEAHASIFLEKPMARTLAEADAMLDACERAHVKMAIAHQMRLHPLVLQLSERLRGGEIGQILEIRARGKEDRRAGGEDLMVLGTHAFDLMRLFAGDPAWCMAHLGVGERDAGPSDTLPGAEGMGWMAGNRLLAVYGLPKGVYGSFASQLNDDRSGARWGLDVYGSNGVVQLRAEMDPKVWVLRANTWTTEKALWERWPAPSQQGSGQLAGNVRLVRDLLESIEQDRRPLSSGYDGRWSLEMILGVYASHRRGGRVRLPLAERRHPLST